MAKFLGWKEERKMDQDKKSEKIITDPEGEIYKIAAKKLSKTTFPKGVKNPLPLNVKPKNDAPDGRD